LFRQKVLHLESNAMAAISLLLPPTGQRASCHVSAGQKGTDQLSWLRICEAACFSCVAVPDTINREPGNRGQVVPMLKAGAKALNRLGDWSCSQCF
jgi:hypothetical protein